MQPKSRSNLHGSLIKSGTTGIEDPPISLRKPFIKDASFLAFSFSSVQSQQFGAYCCSFFKSMITFNDFLTTGTPIDPSGAARAIEVSMSGMYAPMTPQNPVWA